MSFRHLIFFSFYCHFDFLKFSFKVRPSHFSIFFFISTFGYPLVLSRFYFGLINPIVFRCLDFSNPMLILLLALRRMSLRPLEFSFKVRPSDFRFYITPTFDSWKVWHFDLWAFLSYVKSTLYFSSYATSAFFIVCDFDNWTIRKMSFRPLDILYQCHFTFEIFVLGRFDLPTFPSFFLLCIWLDFSSYLFYIFGLSVNGFFIPMSVGKFYFSPYVTFSNFLQENKWA